MAKPLPGLDVPVIDQTTGLMSQVWYTYFQDQKVTSENPGTIQSQIDALGSVGGIVTAPPGDYRSQGTILVPSNVSLIGAGTGSCTFACVVSAGAGRRYNIRLEGFAVAGPFAAAIGVDFRDTTSGVVRDVYITGSDTGLLFANSCFYNLAENVYTSCNVDGIEIYNGANQNTIINCKPSAPIAINVISSNGTTIVGGSGEGASSGSFIVQSGGSSGTNVLGFRGEAPAFGPVWCNDQPLVGNF